MTALFWIGAFTGAACWVLLWELRLRLSSPPPVLLGVGDALLWLYFAVNILSYLRYRRGRLGSSWMAVDVLTNLTALAWIAALTGGLTSPVLLLLCVKVAVYGIVFGALVGASAGALLGVASLALVATGGLSGSEEFARTWPAATMATFETQLAHFTVFVVVLGSFAWLWTQVAQEQRRSREEAQRARGAAERERMGTETANALLRVSNTLAQLGEPRELLDRALEIGCKLLGSEVASALLWNPTSQRYRHLASISRQSEGFEVRREEFPASEVPELEWVRTLGHCVILRAPLGFVREMPQKCTLVAPLQVEGHFHGALQFVRPGEQPFTQYELRLADGLASQLALALERARLVEQSYRLLRAVESTEEGVLILDREGRIQFANPAFVKLFGYRWELVAGKQATSFARPPEQGWAAVSDAIRNRHVWRGEIEVRRHDGQLVPVRLHANSIVEPSGQVEGIVAILEDVRAEKQMQEQLARANRLAAAGELAAGLAHELNNALAAILGQTALARAGQGDLSVLARALRRIEEQAQRMAALVSDMLGFARPAPPRLETARLKDVVMAAAELFAPECDQRGVLLQLGDLDPHIEAQVDSGQIQQVLLNLLRNALQALPSERGGRIVVRSFIREGTAVIEVEDNGAGIPPEILPKIFDPFFSTKKAGTGLGLSISYAIAREHRGNLTLESRPGEGTVARLELPALSPVDKQLDGAAPRAARSRALVVDDDELVAQSLGTMLEGEGWVVRRVHSGREALNASAGEQWDAIFLDVRLPDMDGAEVFQWLAERRPDLARRVVFVSGGFWRGHNALMRAQLPSQPTLAKPCTTDQLKSVLVALQQLRQAA